MQSTQFRIRHEGQGRKGRDCPDRLLAFADEVTLSRFWGLSPARTWSVVRLGGRPASRRGVG